VALQSFDDSLGTLTEITLRVDTTVTLVFDLYPTFTGPASASVFYSGPFDAVVGGLTFSVPTFGYVEIESDWQQFFDLDAHGSASFVIDPSQYDSFVHPSACLFSNVQGMCGYGQPNPTTYISAVAQNASAGEIDYLHAATFTIIYSYASAVPEPDTWLLMLLGFGAIGLTTRRRSSVLPDRRASRQGSRRVDRDLCAVAAATR
jgi:hypothetical protein